MDEHEVKLLVNDLPLPDAADLFAGVGEWSEESIALEATYFDTTDLRLTRAGVSLRWRSDGAWTVKTPVDNAGDALVRHEHEFEGAAESPPAFVQELVLGWTRGARLEEVAHISTRRRRWRLLVHNEPSVEVDDDQVATTSPFALSAEFHEVEIELLSPDGRDAFHEVVERVRRRVGRTESPLPKIARALGPDALRAPDVPHPGRITRRASLGELFQWRVATSVYHFVNDDHRVRLGDEASAIHQARVATRRLRADLQLFAPLFTGCASHDLQVELQWIGGLLGGVRDTDVMLARLRDHAIAAGEADRVDSLLAQLDHARDEQRTILLDAMGSPRYTRLLDELVDLVNRPSPRPRRAAWRASRHAPDLTNRSWKKLRRTVQALPDNPSDDQLHAVRKRAKHLRYAVEAVEPVTGAKTNRLARRATQLQDVLGEHHDAVVAAQWLADTAIPSDTDDAFVAGELAATFRAEADTMRRHWRKAWKRTRRAHANL